MTSPSNAPRTGSPSPKEVSDFHRNADRDSSRESLHHTLGVDPYQASPGSHTHDGRDSKILSGLSVSTHSHLATEIDVNPAGDLSSVNAQAALEELQLEITGHTHDPQIAGLPVEVTGDRSDGTALENLLTALASVGIITDNTVA